MVLLTDGVLILKRARRLWAVPAALLLVAAAVACPAHGEPVRTGDFSFSDELGTFSILRASGAGSPDDPIVLDLVLTHTEPVIMVIRRVDHTAEPEAIPSAGRWVAVHLKLVVHNQSRRVWQGFEVELQEILHQPSVREDGLSFDQGAMSPASVTSDRFAANHRQFEPYDRIKFLQGHVNPMDFVEFKLHITDLTPVTVFYLLLDPEILFSQGPARAPRNAAS